MDTVEVMQVIKTTLTRRGEGVVGDPIRIITQYWSMAGEPLCEIDPWGSAADQQQMPSEGK